jgi:uncharacterized membrane protein YdjX (TVP38/TMEM64 family)
MAIVSSETLGFILTVLGLTAAAGIFLLAARLVAHARAATRNFRVVHHDPHAPRTMRELRQNDGRDIKQ